MTGTDRSNLSIKRAFLSVQTDQIAREATGPDRLSQEGGQPLWTIWVTSISLALGVVHMTLTNMRCYYWLILLLISH